MLCHYFCNCAMIAASAPSSVVLGVTYQMLRSFTAAGSNFTDQQNRAGSCPNIPLPCDDGTASATISAMNPAALIVLLGCLPPPQALMALEELINCPD